MSSTTSQRKKAKNLTQGAVKSWKFSSPMDKNSAQFQTLDEMIEDFDRRLDDINRRTDALLARSGL